MSDNEVIRNTLNQLIASVEVDEFDRNPENEYTILGKIAVRAGLMWRCANPDCRCVNHLNTTKCDSCNRFRPKSRDIPRPDGWA